MSKMNVTINEIISVLEHTKTKISDPQEVITSFNSIHESKKHDMTFCSYKDDTGIKMIHASNASLIICHQSLYDVLCNKPNLVFVKNPRLAFINCIKKFFPNNDEIRATIHPTAIVESKHVGKNVHIGSHAHIGKNVVIGENSIISDNVIIYGNVHIGKNVLINPNTVIGKEGFGFERDEDGMLIRFPHIGGVRIDDNVEIGSNATVDRGTLNDTIIGSGSKIDSHVHVGHNVKIGKNCIIVSNTLIGGSCTIGENVRISLTVTLREGIKIGNNSLIGMGSVVTRNVPEHVVAYGNPSKIIRDYP